MTSVTYNRQADAPSSHVPAREPSQSGGIRDLLRDTALLVTSLTGGGTTMRIVELQERCRELITRFAEALRRRGYAEDVCHDAEVAHCGLLDEMALRHFRDNERSAWESKPLQVEYFGMHDAGERVFDRLEQRLRETTPQVDLLECYSAVLGMGFAGRYARDGHAKLGTLNATLNARIEKLRPGSARPFTADHTVRRLSDWLYRLSPWAIALATCVVAAVVWMVWRTALDAQLAHLLPGKLRP